MNLDIATPSSMMRWSDEILGNHGRIYNAFPDPHGKKAVRIASKGLTVKEIPPPANDLPVISPRIPVSAIEKKD